MPAVSAASAALVCSRQTAALLGAKPFCTFCSRTHANNWRSRQKARAVLKACRPCLETGSSGFSCPAARRCASHACTVSPLSCGGASESAGCSRRNCTASVASCCCKWSKVNATFSWGSHFWGLFCVRKTDLKMRPLLWRAEGTALSSEATGDGAPQYKKWALPLLAPLPTACTNFSMHAQRL